MIGPGPDKDSTHPATPLMPTIEQAVALDLLADVEQVAQEAEQACFALARAHHDLHPSMEGYSRLQRAICRLESAATHLHHISQR